MMIRLTIQPEFARAYQQYADYRPGDTLRLYVRTSGPGTGGLFYAIERDQEQAGDALFEVEGLRFVIRPADFWYFDGGSLRYDKRLGEFGFQFDNPKLD
ncbi:iron-sulfur cluster biosynthesis family protein [Brevibacillus sp. B_LB10_24]